LSRLPLRAKLTLAFALAMTSLLVAAGVVLVGRLDPQLDRTVAAGLRVQAGDVAAVVTASRRAGRELMLRRGPGHGLALLARPAGADRVVVVGTSLERRAQARSALVRVAALAGPAVLLLAVAAGYGVAFLALRPAAAMRRRAAAVTAGGSGQRLPVPRARGELASLGRTLNDMIERLERALARERMLVADVGHELRTPLAIARAEVELALRPDAPREELAEALRSVGEEVERLVRLSDDLLVLARADHQALRLERRRIAVPELLERVGDRARRASGGALAVSTEATPGVEVEADSLHVEQALSNLVTNSSRYGASRVRIWSSVQDGGAIGLHVSDDGPGFAEDFLPRAFDRFARGTDARTGGCGLGLAIVDVIARAHGGTAGARNVRPRGADVWIALPRAEARPAGPSPARASELAAVP
jgi:signal transduction histidine kinase